MIVPAHRLLFWVTALLPVLAIGSLLPQAWILPASLFAALAVAAAGDAAVALSRRREIRIALPEVVRLSRDRQGAIPVRILNARAAALRIRLGLPLPPAFSSSREFLDVLLPAGHAESGVAWDCTPSERGSFPLRVCAFEIPSPLGLWNARGRSECRSELRVYPNLMKERKKLAALFLNRGNFGLHARRTIGQGREFEKLREYIPGDSYEDIHWKATAKRGKPVTKLFQVERTQEIYAVIDASRLSARQAGGETALEHYIASALVLALVAERQGDLFGLIVFADKVHRFIRASSGKAHFNACRDALYTLTSQSASPDFDELMSFIRLRLRRRALLLTLTDLADPLLAESFLRGVEKISRQHLMLVSMLRRPEAAPIFSAPDADSTEALYDRLGGHMMWRKLREIEKALARRGVTLAFADSKDLSAQLVSRYMDVKARQSL